jgi:hypothetical protein
MCIDRVLKVRLDKIARCLTLRGQKKPAGIKLQYFCQYGDRKKNNQRTKLSIYILDTIESESTTRFKNRSFIPAGFFCPHTVKHLAILSKRTFNTRSIHIFGLVYYLSTSRNSPFYIRC